MSNEKWTKEQIEEHITVNVKEYGAMIVVAALFRKIYGVHPSIGLSGFQGEAILNIEARLPDSFEGTK